MRAPASRAALPGTYAGRHGHPAPARAVQRPAQVQHKIDVEQLRLYDEFGVELPFFRFGSPERCYFRLSAHLHNSLAEYEYLAEALQALLY
jgi:hypothetical protein